MNCIDVILGVEAQTVTVWRQANTYKVPRIAYLNKMDKRGADFAGSVHSLQKKLNATTLVLQLPIGSAAGFKGVVDLVEMKKLLWKPGHGQQYQMEAVSPADGKLWDSAMAARLELVGQLADVNEEITEAILADVDAVDIPVETIRQAIRSATLHHAAVPVLCGSSHKNICVQPLLDAVTQYLPSPADVHHDFMQHYGNSLCALAFKIIHTKQRGPLTFLRLYGGELKTGTSIFNVNRGLPEKVSRVYQVFADEHKEMQTVSAGNIVALGGLKEVGIAIPIAK